MPILDQLTVLSDAQAVTADAASTNVINRGAAARELAQPLTFEARVDTLFDSSGEAATLTIAIQGSATEAFSTAVDLAATGAIAEASLTAGAVFRIIVPAGTAYQYLRGYYTTGTEDFTAGKIDLYPVFTTQQGLA